MDLKTAVEQIRPLDKAAEQRARERWLSLAKPLFGLGAFEDIISRIAGIKGREYFSLEKKAVVVMCADNGVVAEGVTQTGQEVTATVTGNFRQGTASVCILAKKAGAQVFPIDIGVASDVEGVTDRAVKIAYGTKNIAKEPAMTREQAVAAIEIGINQVKSLKEAGYDIIATGEMGIGNTTTSSAIASVLLNAPPEQVTGRGAGLSTEGLNRKIAAIKKAIEVTEPDRNDPIDVLSKVGGLDIAGLAGVFIGGAAYRVPVVADGFISAAAALAAVSLCPEAGDYIIGSHCSKEPASALIFKALGLKPVINADMCLGEGTGAVYLFPLLDLTCEVYTKLHTFQSWDGDAVYTILE